MPSLTFAAVLAYDGTLHVEPGFVVDAPPTPVDDGAVEVVALGRGGRALARTMLSLDATCAPPVDGAAAEPSPPVVIGVVDVPDGTTGLAVNIDGRPAWERTAPTDPPEPLVDWPRALQRGPVEISWSASTEACQAALGYSVDRGRTWLPLSLPSASTTIVADLTHQAGGDCLLELVVSDGFHTERVRSEPLALETAGWQVWIMAPADGAAVDAGEVTVLTGQAYHAEDRQPFFGLSWTSSIDGALGIGGRLPVSLSPGLHSLTATAHDRSVSVRVESA
jgi:hypothetical protein